jgi:serine phosphatase RsbU (regulator of sigma subunit)
MQLDIAWYIETATEVGGDYYDYALADDGTLTLTLGDATGHGMAAGSLIFATKSLFRNLSHQADMAETFTAMSRSLKEMNLQRIGMAMNMVKIKDHTMHVSSAGIPPILLYRAASQTVEKYSSRGCRWAFRPRPSMSSRRSSWRRAIRSYS